MRNAQFEKIHRDWFYSKGKPPHRDLNSKKLGIKIELFRGFNVNIHNQTKRHVFKADLAHKMVSQKRYMIDMQYTNFILTLIIFDMKS